MKSKISKICINIGIIYILIIILVVIIFINPNIEINSGTFVGICVSMMAITMAIIIGYQAISAYEIKKELKDYKDKNDELLNRIEDFEQKVKDQLKDYKESINKDITSVKTEIKELNKQLEFYYNTFQEKVYILNALIIEETYNDMGCIDSFNSMHYALSFALNYKSDNIEFIMDKLRLYIQQITTNVLEQCKISDGVMKVYDERHNWKHLKDKVNEIIIPIIKKQETNIINNKNFSSISYYYKSLMKELYDRIETCTTRRFPANHNDIIGN